MKTASREILCYVALIGAIASTSATTGRLRVRHLVVTTNATLSNISDANGTNSGIGDDVIIESDLDGVNADDGEDIMDDPALPPPPSNDLCPKAQEITAISGSPFLPATPLYSGTTVGADRDRLGCGAQVVVTSRKGRVVGPGVWYKVQGTGEIMSASTCSETTSNLDTVIQIFQGTCDNRECVVSSDDAPEPHVCDTNKLASFVSWETRVGVDYYILVYGNGVSAVGPFELSLIAYRRNDVCPAAHEVPLGTPIPGDTKDSKVDAGDALEECGFDRGDYQGEWAHIYGERFPKALWYSVIGTGKKFIATTCQADDFFKLHAYRMHVFAGSCDSCVGGDEDTTTCPTYEWETTAGTTYYIAVHRTYTSDTDIAGEIAPFQLIVRENGNSMNSSRGGSEIFD